MKHQPRHPAAWRIVALLACGTLGTSWTWLGDTYSIGDPGYALSMNLQLSTTVREHTPALTVRERFKTSLSVLRPPIINTESRLVDGQRPLQVLPRPVTIPLKQESEGQVAEAIGNVGMAGG